MKSNFVVRRSLDNEKNYSHCRSTSSNNGLNVARAFSAGLAALLAASYTPAIAQSSVTLYGDVDNGLMYTSNQGGHTNWQLSNAGLYSTLFGFTGTEDLAGGLKAVFKLESGVNPNSGMNTFGGLFGRQAYVGLSSPYGTVRLGRQFDATCDLLAPVTAGFKFGGGLAANAGDVNNTFCDFNVTNAVKYLSPTVAGFTGELVYRFGGVAGDFSNGSLFDAALSYTHGYVTLVGNYERVDNPAIAIWNATTQPAAGQTWANPLTSPIYLGYASAKHYQTAGVGANIAVGSGTIGLLWTNTLFQDVIRTSSTPFNGTAVFNDLQVNYAINITPSWLTGIGVNYTWAPQASYEQVELGTKYLLSKRTILYITSGYQHARGTNSLGHSAVAALSNVPASSSPNQLAIRIGIHHNF